MNLMFPTINASLAVLVVLVNFVFTILVMVRSPRTIIYMIFLCICISNMFWNFGDFMEYLSGNRLWFYFSRVGSHMLPALMFHLLSVIVRPEQKHSFWVDLAYALSGVMAITAAAALIDPRIRLFMDSAYRNVSYIILLAPFLVAGIVLLLIALSRTLSDDEKSRLHYIIGAALIAVPTGLTDLLQPFSLPVPPLGHIGCLAYSIVLGVGVFKHRSAYDILSQMRMKLEGLGHMAAGIAHEIRNPLTAIKGASVLLGKEMGDSADASCWEYLRVVTEEVERLDKILGNFQYYIRPLRADKELISINNAIQKTVQLAEMHLLKIRIRLELPETIPLIHADPLLMRQLFLNLIKNAAEACGPAGTLIIKTEAIPPGVKITFSDDGPGIAPELFDRVFEPFFTTKAKGMGLGLAVCKNIVQAHDGRIEVRSRSPIGSEIYVSLPG